MNFGYREDNRVICRFNLRGMCRFGDRCRNIHIAAESLREKMETENKVSPMSDPVDSVTASLGACALSPKKFGTLPKVTASSKTTGKKNFLDFGPSTSSIEQAVTLVKKAESAEKSCGICFDTILEKTSSMERTFGILPNCNHCFCFTCIRKWRQSKEFELDVAKACPECRIKSDYVYPSKYWIENKGEKDEFIDVRNKRMKTQDCRYFRQGKGSCPFGNTCRYLHALPNGRTIDLGPPPPRRHRSTGIDSELVGQILALLNEGVIMGDEDDDDDFITMDDDILHYIALEHIFRDDDDDDDSDCDIEFF